MNQAGKPNTIKVINQTIIRNICMRRTALTCAEISAETGISITTVRAIMNEMLARGELVSLGLAESSGGRRSEQFIINDECYEGISICVTQRPNSIHTTEKDILVSRVNIHSEVLETQVISLRRYQDLAGTIKEILSDRITEKTRAIGIGVPGIVSPDGYIQKVLETLYTVDVLPVLKQHFDMPIIVENDLRSSALGFSRQIQKELHPAELYSAELYSAPSTVAFINFEASCNQISAGFVEGNKIIHGMGNYAGELWLMPYDDKRTFCEAIYNASSEKECMRIIALLLSVICCTINPQHIMLCSDADFFIDGEAIGEYITKRLPPPMIPKLSVDSDFKKYFIAGMASLTADAIFTEGEGK
ncbi:MAG: ROK family protein [Spirochaetaceae bacterium]|jgi:DNA-binding transcriptional regulator GbsR (MarR family)|nr:ROK family protein [Spirochaetaceae bacterium]